MIGNHLMPALLSLLTKDDGAHTEKDLIKWTSAQHTSWSRLPVW